MAKQKVAGGAFSGRVGRVVECQWKGVRYVRALPAYVNDPKTTAQLTQRAKFKAAHAFVQTLLYTVHVGYAAFAVRQTAYNACLSHTLRQVAVGKDPDVALDYSKALLGEGPLAVAEHSAITLVDQRAVVTWNHAVVKGNGAASDTTLVALYCPARNEALQLMDSAQRADGTLSIKLPKEWQQCEVHCFMGFRSANKQSVSNIGHIGSFYDDIAEEARVTTAFAEPLAQEATPLSTPLASLPLRSLSAVNAPSQASLPALESTAQIRHGAIPPDALPTWHAIVAAVKQLPWRHRWGDEVRCCIIS